MVMIGRKPNGRPSRGTSCPGKSSTRPRGKSTAAGELIEGDGSVSDSSYNESEEEEEPQPQVRRKSARLQNAKLKGLRRSSRIGRNHTSNLFDPNRPNPVRPFHQMKNKRVLSTIREEGITSSKAQRSLMPQPHNNGEGAEQDEKEPGEDQTSDCDQSMDTKASHASSVYNANDMFKETFRICASGPNSLSNFRPPLSPWMNKTSDDESVESDLHSAMARCRPVNLSFHRDKLMSEGSLADIDPVTVDPNVGFQNIGGLSSQIAALKEMVVFPLMYPEVFQRLNIEPPRGCLFHGPPGTGKTLVARALARECCQGPERVSFFMRKGGDVLSKWVGESERQLRLLFQQAYEMRPSIIFFDELDGLAPVRSSRQDQIHSSIVSTLLALMDGLNSRGEVVVIGSTNRLDSIDPALRRPGRFDREFLFGLPDKESRAEILKIHTRLWKPVPSEDFLQELSEKCVGYSGADVRGLCTEAALCALRRRYPQIYSTSQKLQLDVASISVNSADFLNAAKKMRPTAHRSHATASRPLTITVLPLLTTTLQGVLERVQRLFPHAKQPASKTDTALIAGLQGDNQINGGSSISASGRRRKPLNFIRSAVAQPCSHRPRLLIVGEPAAGHSSHLAPAVLNALERFPLHSLEISALYGTSHTSAEEKCAQVFCEARRSSPSLLYLPHLHLWWETAGGALRSSFLTLLSGISTSDPVLLLCTSDRQQEDLDPEVACLFQQKYGEVFEVTAPSDAERTRFFSDLILNQTTEAPPPKGASRPLELLPMAPPPRPRQLSAQERRRVEEQEEDMHRELRRFLRHITERLSLDRRFKTFTKPVDTVQVPDYLQVIKHPMDLSSLLTNIDKHKYITVNEFVRDADLIWNNALKYNPDSATLDRNIRHRAHALKDALHAIIREHLDPEFEKACEEMKERRMRRAALMNSENDPRQHTLKKKRSRRKSKWSTGVIPKPKKKKAPVAPPVASSESCSSLSSLSDASEDSDVTHHDVTRSLNGDVTAEHQSLTNGFHNGSPQGERQRRLAKRAMTEQLQLLGRDDNESTTLPLVVDRSKLRDLLQCAVKKTEGAKVEALEKLYSALSQCIYRHCDNHDKSELIREMETEVDRFS